MKHPAALGKYQVTSVLGEGAMGVVYKGFDPDIRRPVALKTIRHQLVDGSEAARTVAARFRNEAQAAGRLSHPGIVGVYEYGEDAQVAYIAMEYVEGRSIASVLASQVRFTDQDIPGLMSQLLDALDYAHAQGVWHRDIKPANVILSRGGRLKIADFGIARIAGDESAGLTQTHMMLGTPAYMAPEQFTGGHVGPGVDIYAAGVLLYVLLTGGPPFTGGNDALMYRAVHETPLPPSEVDGAHRPHFYDALIGTALAKRSADRFRSAAAFKDALAAAVGRPIDVNAWEQTVVLAAPQPLDAPAHPSCSTLGGAVRHWDRSVLQQAQGTLAQFLGPMATVLVRRAARECGTVPELYTWLAEHVTDPSARRAFLGRLAATGQTTGGHGHGGSGGSGGTGGVALRSQAGLVISETRLAQAQHLLALRLGPIAKVVVKKAAAQSRDWDDFAARVADCLPDPAARNSLLAELERLA